jgi:zinc protease
VNPKVLLEADHSLPLTHFSLSALSGAAADPSGLEGLTRLSLRLMRRTAGGRAPDDNEALLDRLGASLGVDANHTGASLSGTCLARSLPALFGFLREALQFRLNRGELERLTRESRAELFELLDSDEQLVQLWFGRTLFEGHPYGRMPLGTAASLQAITERDVRACLGRHFSAGNILLGLAGDVSAEHGQRLFQELLDGLGQAIEPVAAVTEPKPLPAGRRLLFVDKPERTQNQVLMGCIGSHPRDTDHVALLVGNAIFGGAFSSRLMREVRSKRGWSYGATSSLSFERERQSLSVWTFPGAADAARCIALQLEMIEELASRGVTDAEMQWARQHLVQSQAFGRDTAPKRVGLLLEQELWQLPPGYFDEFQGRVAHVTLDEVNAALKHWVTPERWLTVVVGTHADNGAAIEAAIPGLTHAEVVPYDSAL